MILDFIRPLAFLPFVFVLSCANGHCGRTGGALKERSNRRILVYKYDGSKQCEQKEGVDLEAMSRELSAIKIYSKSKRSDGQIRVQVCGALTGVSNVYEIKQKDLPLAESLGFKKWDF